MIRLASVPLLLALAACTTDNFSVVLLKNVKPTEGDCVVEADVGALGLTRGVLDVLSPLPNGALNPGYTLTPIASNSTIGASPTGGEVGNPNGQLFFVQGSETELVAGTSAESQQIIDFLAGRGLTTRVQRFSTSIPPNGISGLSFSIIDEEQTAAINEVLGDRVLQILARVQIFGLLDDSTIRTPVFEYPVTLCRGCNIQDFGACSALAFGTTIPNTGCNPLQDDGRVACCTTDTGAFLCPARSTAPPPPEEGQGTPDAGVDH
jgi:hypothetical protein